MIKQIKLTMSKELNELEKFINKQHNKIFFDHSLVSNAYSNGIRAGVKYQQSLNDKQVVDWEAVLKEYDSRPESSKVHWFVIWAKQHYSLVKKD